MVLNTTEQGQIENKEGTYTKNIVYKQILTDFINKNDSSIQPSTNPSSTPSPSTSPTPSSTFDINSNEYEIVYDTEDED